MEGKGKGDGHQHGRKPRILEPVPIGSEGTLGTYGRWAHGAMDGWMDNWICILTHYGT